MVFATIRVGLSLSALTVSALFMVGVDDKKSNQPEAIHIGIMSTFYRDHSEEDVKVTVESLRDLMMAQTGFKGDPIKVSGIEELGGDLMKDKFQLGVFFGHEFAWVHNKFPNLKPLLIVVNQIPYQRAYLFGRKSDNLTNFAQLKGRKLAVAAHTPEPCHFYLNRLCQDSGTKIESYFSKMAHPDHVEAALDDLVDGVVDLVIAEEAAMNSYKRRKPGRFAKLREILMSPQFPAAVVVYLPKKWNETDLKSIRDALLDAHKSPEGRQLLTLWRLTGFEPVPKDYEENLSEIHKPIPSRARKGDHAVLARPGRWIFLLLQRGGANTNVAIVTTAKLMYIVVNAQGGKFQKRMLSKSRPTNVPSSTLWPANRLKSNSHRVRGHVILNMASPATNPMAKR